jgi:NYN domain/RNA recognition motif. (a.k.a. RRM, RBD, or RNP domain)
MRGFEVIKKVKDFVTEKALQISIFTAIGNHTTLHQDSILELQDCGVNLQLSAGKSSTTTDVSILGEIMKTIYINKPPYAIVLISGDREFSKVLNFMVGNGFRVILIHAPSVSPVLLSSTRETISWSDLLGLAKLDDAFLLSIDTNSSSPFSDLKALVEKHPEGILSWRIGQSLPLIYMVNGFDTMKEYIFAAEKNNQIQIINRNDPSGNMIVKPYQKLYSPFPAPLQSAPNPLLEQPCMMISESDSGVTLQNELCNAFDSLGTVDEILSSKFFPSQAPALPTLDQATAVSRALFVRNIQFSVKESEVLDYFKPFGAIKSHVALIQNRGLFFVVFYDLRDAVRAIDTLGSLEFKGREADLHFRLGFLFNPSVPKEGELPEKAQVCSS